MIRRLAELLRDLFELECSATQARRQLLLQSTPPSGSVGHMTNTSFHLKATGEKTEIAPKGSKTFSLEELQGYVGGYIEAVNLPGHRIMFVNEDGRLHNLPLNHAASELAESWIFGDVVVCDRKSVQ